MTGQKNSVCVTGQTGLNPTPVVAGDKKVTVNLNVDFCVANAHIVTRLPQKKGVYSFYRTSFSDIRRDLWRRPVKQLSIG